MSASEYLTQLLEWLQLEREEDLRLYQETVLSRSLKERVKRGVSWHPAEQVRSFIGLGDKIVLELQYNEEKAKKSSSFQSGSVVSVFGTNVATEEAGRITGVISAITKNSMKVALGTENLPNWVNHSYVGVDLAFDDRTYRDMAGAVQAALDAKKNSRLYELRELLLGEMKPDTHHWHVPFQVPNLNDSQNKAMNHALEAKDVAIVHGPPGTGKTTTLVQIIHEVAQREPQVLVCASSNTAVDLLTLRCYEAGLSVLRMGNPARVDEELHVHTIEGSMAAHPDYESLRKLRREAAKIREHAMKHKRKFGQQERERRQELLKEAREMKALSRKLEDYILFQLLDRSEVIVATLTGAGHKLLKNKRFGTVVIDEAAQALTPACFIPMQKADRVIMAGDHCQLPPTVKSAEAMKLGLAETLFERVMANKSVSHMLEVQYRMPDRIMRFSAQQFYDDRLRAAPEVAKQQLAPTIENLEFVDTAGCGFEEARNPESRSTANPEEAQLLLRHLAMLFNQLEKENPEILKPPFSVGIIAPYKEQVRHLKRQLQGSPMLSSYASFISIKTVDGFQGQERDVIYISLVRSNSKGDIGFLRDTRRMNVALTRARKKMVVVGDSGTIGKHPFYQAFLDYVEKQDAYHTAWEWMVE